MSRQDSPGHENAREKGGVRGDHEKPSKQDGNYVAEVNELWGSI